MDADYVIGNPERIGYSLVQFKQKQAQVRIFGVNDAGNSVVAVVHNFFSYFFVPKLQGCTQEDIPVFASALNVSKHTIWISWLCYLHPWAHQLRLVYHLSTRMSVHYFSTYICIHSGSFERI